MELAKYLVDNVEDGRDVMHYICAKTGRCVSHDEANSALLQVISDGLSEGFFCNRFRRKLDGSIVFDFGGRISHALWIVAKTGNTNALIHFNEWIKEMCREIEKLQTVDYENINMVIANSLAERKALY